MDSTACPASPATPMGSEPSQGRCQSFFQVLLDRLKGIPGEESVALTSALPLNAIIGNYAYDAEGHPREPRQGALLTTERTVSPGYFAALGMSPVRGRLLDEQDFSGVSRAAVIDQVMAQHLWPNENPLGRHILNVNDEPQPAIWNAKKALTVVGVVSNTREGNLAEGFGDEVYLPTTPTRQNPTMYVLLRTRAATEEAAAELRRTVAAVDPQVPVTRIRTLNEVVSASESAPRSLSTLLLILGGLAVVIGSVGVYSLIAYIVSWRTREFGIRLALGARRWQIVHNVVQQSLLLALGGSAAGLLAAALAGQVLRRFLFGVTPIDPATFAAVALLMTLLAIAAASIPARRAASVDPMKALRME